ncbi:carboxymuconolactone decarboxylase family protein [Paracraurococcus lichenis]|uniref:Carboxymuconolactone decarboxylase family protein n=1 Tax=Paracraurococcus lichenis TaxID=3064888 RepID=A0ABT9DZY2_9PROT|nr:carboxymuconolactone decarboxylase family protein [Paracraurococcus sp. LOR1-02]MDO9709452.1 carboxymuconolactone decarboxylase family protein [Paracraurococcus sp. LOR1-02]
MTDFTRHTPETAPAGEQLAQIRKGWGFIPNLHATLAESPTALQGYDTLFGLVGQGTLTPAEQQVAFITASRINECEYCVSGHSVLAGAARLDAASIAALREGTPLPDAKLDALARFTAAVVEQRGRLSEAQVEAFLAAGYSRAQVLEVVLAVATKTISNYVNHLTKTPLDAFMAKTAWTAPSRRAA